MSRETKTAQFTIGKQLRIWAFQCDDYHFHAVVRDVVEGMTKADKLLIDKGEAVLGAEHPGRPEVMQIAELENPNLRLVKVQVTTCPRSYLPPTLRLTHSAFRVTSGTAPSLISFSLPQFTRDQNEKILRRAKICKGDQQPMPIKEEALMDEVNEADDDVIIIEDTEPKIKKRKVELPSDVTALTYLIGDDGPDTYIRPNVKEIEDFWWRLVPIVKLQIEGIMCEVVIDISARTSIVPYGMFKNVRPIPISPTKARHGIRWDTAIPKEMSEYYELRLVWPTLDFTPGYQTINLASTPNFEQGRVILGYDLLMKYNISYSDKIKELYFTETQTDCQSTYRAQLLTWAKVCERVYRLPDGTIYPEVTTSVFGKCYTQYERDDLKLVPRLNPEDQVSSRLLETMQPLDKVTRPSPKSYWWKIPSEYRNLYKDELVKIFKNQAGSKA